MLTSRFDNKIQNTDEGWELLMKDADLQSIAALDEIGRRVVAKLQSHTQERRPPARRGGANRYAHPGHWADVTGALASQFGYKVDRARGKNTLTIYNTDREGYGAILEQREGFFVLRGIDQPGGLVDQIMRQVVREVTTWTIT